MKKRQFVKEIISIDMIDDPIGVDTAVYSLISYNIQYLPILTR